MEAEFEKIFGDPYLVAAVNWLSKKKKKKIVKYVEFFGMSLPATLVGMPFMLSSVNANKISPRY